MSRRALGPLLLSVTAVVATSCAATTYDTSATTVDPADSTPATVFAPQGSTSELIAQLSAAVGGLSALIIANDGQGESLARIETLWALVRPPIEADRPELLQGFDTVFDLVRSSVERRRPADADKAYNNLNVLIAAYES